jgi:hypothetical protein
MKKLPFLIVIMFVMSFAACKKEGEPTCTAGKGGSTKLIIYPAHHGEAIPGATAYIEFNTQTNAGATSNYDLTVHAKASEGHIDVTGLRCGEYFIYCTGYDTDISQPVFGGIPFVIKPYQTEVEVHVPVTE